MSDRDGKGLATFLGLVLGALLIAGGVWWSWYRAGVQAEVYRREGVEMTQWEVYLGARPAERTVNVKRGGGYE